MEDNEKQVTDPNVEESKQESVESKEAEVPQLPIRQLLDNAGGPSESEIEKLKAQHGDVFVSAFSDDEVYVWRALTRREFVDLQAALQNPENNMDQFAYEETICKQCVLWPRVDDQYFAKGKGGTPSSLAEQIMQNSNFYSPQVVSQLVAKL